MKDRKDGYVRFIMDDGEILGPYKCDIIPQVKTKITNDKSKLNGTFCPKCESELYDSNPTITLMIMPPKINVHCSKCNYIGYRIVQ